MPVLRSQTLKRKLTHYEESEVEQPKSQGEPKKRKTSKGKPLKEAQPEPPHAKRLAGTRTFPAPVLYDVPSRKRQKPALYGDAWHGKSAERRINAAVNQTERLAPGEKERRLRSYVDEPPQSYYDFLNRANTQRMFVLERERGVEPDCHANHNDCPYETLQIAGSTGNVYTVRISHLPSCTCPVGIFTRKGQEKLCKHALYVLHHVLKAPRHLETQNAFLTSELREIFAKAPALPNEAVEEQPQDGHRKPVADDCPICCMAFEEGEDLVWCKAACGNNLHKACFDQWARTRPNVTCPFCRSRWEYDLPPAQKSKASKITTINMPAAINNSGYRNVKDQLDYGA